MNKIKFFVLTALTVMGLAFVSCGGKESGASKKDITFEGKYGTIEFTGDTVTMNIDGAIDKGTYTGNPSKDGTVTITIKEESKDGGESFYDYNEVYKVEVENEVLTLELDHYPFNFSVVK